MSMTPDDMEGRLQAHANGALIADIYGGSFADRFDRYQADLRALLLDYQERGRALRFYADEHEYPSDGPWGVNSDDFGNRARAALTGEDA